MKNVSTIEQIKIQLLYVFVFSICFQPLELFGLPYLSLTWTALFMYFIANLFTFKKSFAFNADVRFYVLPIALFWLLVLVMTYVNYEPYAKAIYGEIRQMLMGIGLLLLMINHLRGRRDEQEMLLLIFVLSVTALAISYLFGIQTSYSDEGRLGVWGNNSNSVSLWSGIAVLILMNIMLQEKRKLFVKIVAVALALLFLVVMAKTGSRGGLAALIAAYIVYCIMINKPLKIKIIAVFISAVAGSVGLFFMLNYSVLKNRIAEQVADESFGGRKPIWEAGVNMFMKYPVFGAGAGRYQMDISDIFGKFVVTHNEYLTILVYTGIVGFSIFLLFQYHLFKGVMRSRMHDSSALMYSFITMYLVWLFAAGGALPTLTTWFVWGSVALFGTRPDFSLKNLSLNVKQNQYKNPRNKFQARL